MSRRRKRSRRKNPARQYSKAGNRRNKQAIRFVLSLFRNANR